MPNNLPPLASKLCVVRVRIAEGQFIAGSAAKSYTCNRQSLWSLRSDAIDWEAAEAARKAKADADAKAAAEVKAAAEGKAAAEAKAADDKLWIFTKKWFNLRFVLQCHKQSLYAFAAAGHIEIGARGSSFGFRSLELMVKNCASCPLKVLVPRGTWFHNRTPFRQPLVTIRDRWIEIEPGALATVELDTFCGISTYGCPDRDEMELSPYVFDGDDVMTSQSNVWAYFSPYVPAIPKKHQPSNPAASISPDPQLDKKAAEAVVENVRGPEHEDAKKDADEARKTEEATKATAEAKAAAELKAAAEAKAPLKHSRNLVPPTTFSDGYTGDIARGQPKAQNRADFSKWRRDSQLPPPAAPPVKRFKWRDALLKLRDPRKSFPFASFKHLPSVKRLASFSMRKQWET